MLLAWTCLGLGLPLHSLRPSLSDVFRGFSIYWFISDAARSRCLCSAGPADVLCVETTLVTNLIVRSAFLIFECGFPLMMFINGRENFVSHCLNLLNANLVKKYLLAIWKQTRKHSGRCMNWDFGSRPVTFCYDENISFNYTASAFEF